MDNKIDILQEFKESQAILKGHFILSSGLHSDTYLQCARVLMNPQRAERLCKQLADYVNQTITDTSIDIVVAPAMGGVIVGYEMGRQLKKDTIFCERVDGSFTLRRGFTLSPGQNVLVVEDIVTTGKSSLETFNAIRSYGANIVAEACLIDRSNGTVDLGVPLISLIQLEVKTYTEEELPETLKAIPAEKPGSRFL